MRILQLISTLTGGGAERQLAYLSGELRRRGHEVSVGYFRYGLGVWSGEAPIRQLSARNARDPQLIAEAFRLIRSFKADLVQTWTLQMDVVGGVAAIAAGVPWILREPSACENYGRGLRPRLRMWVARTAAEAVVANSGAGERYWAARAPRLRRFLVRNAVAIEAIEATVPIERAAEVPVGVFVGRLEALKNVDVLLRACAAVMAERGLVLFLCGEGPQRERLLALSHELRIASRVRFTGFVSDVWRYVRAADFTILLSDSEGDPNAVIEAFAAGKPVILSDIPAHRELARGGSAVLVPPRDVTATARAIRSLLDDPTTASRLSSRARHAVAERSIAAAAGAFEEVYTSVISRRRALSGLEVPP